MCSISFFTVPDYFDMQMESRVIFRCKFGVDVAIFSLNNGMTLNEMCAIIRTKFNELSSADFSVKYVLPGSEPCVLSSDEDMGFMFAFIPLVTAEHVELIVHLNEVSRDLSAAVIQNVDPKFSLNIDVDVQEQSGGRVFLCEAWKGCITHVQQRFPGGVKDFSEVSKFSISKDEDGIPEYVAAVYSRKSKGSNVIDKYTFLENCNFFNSFYVQLLIGTEITSK
ncbi:hypothetical protein LguiA_000471 [Lonicera macranthoides]